MLPEELIAFEADIAAEFNAGKISSPVHLYSGGEESLIKIFDEIRRQDWVLCTWRSHYQCLLKGVPAHEVKAKIMANHSIALCFPEYRILSSAPVGGTLPIAVGIAMGIKRSGEDARVYCFIGDMTAETGIAHESIKYAKNFDLPLDFIIEDNGISVCTNTKESWGIVPKSYLEFAKQNVRRFYYQPGRYPHSGAGKRVQF